MNKPNRLVSLLKEQRPPTPQHVPVSYFSVCKFVYFWLLYSSSFFQNQKNNVQTVTLSLLVFFCFSLDCKNVELAEALV